MNTEQYQGRNYLIYWGGGLYFHESRIIVRVYAKIILGGTLGETFWVGDVKGNRRQ